MRICEGNALQSPQSVKMEGKEELQAVEQPVIMPIVPVLVHNGARHDIGKEGPGGKGTS